MPRLGFFRQGACDGDSLTDVCRDPAICSVCSLWERPDESREAWLARIRQAYHAAGRGVTPGQRAPRPQVTRDRSALLALLADDTWTTVPEIAAQVGMSAEAVRHALKRERERGVPIESSRLGWRRVRKEVAAA